MAIYEHMEKFDPSTFGLSERYKGRGKSGNNGKCYIQRQNGGTGKNQLKISLTEYAGKRVIETLGSRIEFDFDKDGVIYLWSGNSRKLSTHCKNTTRYTISVGAMFDDYIRKMGEFSRLYVKPEFNGNYVKLVPTGERDALGGVA